MPKKTANVPCVIYASAIIRNLFLFFEDNRQSSFGHIILIILRRTMDGWIKEKRMKFKLELTCLRFFCYLKIFIDLFLSDQIEK